MGKSSVKKSIRPKSEKKFSAGFSLLELLLALSIFSICAYSVGVLLIDSINASRLGLEKSQAALYAYEGIEAARSVRDNNWDDLAVGTSYGVVTGSSSLSLIAAQPDVISNKFTRTVTVTASTSILKIVQSAVTWSFNAARPENVTLTTYFGRWK